MMRRAALAVCAFVLLSARPAGAWVMPNDIDFICTIHHVTASDLNSLKKLPDSVKAYIAGSIGPMADRGEFFNSTDVIAKPAPSARFIRAGRVGDYWFLWYERGGIAYSKHIVVLHLDLELTQIADKTYGGQDDPCPLTDALIDKAR
jgi:hypothetical protein